MSPAQSARFVPHIVPRDNLSCEESWSEWQDLNLRPPRPERGSGPAEFPSELHSYAVEKFRTRLGCSWTRLLIQASMIEPAAISASRRVPTTAVSFGRSLSGKYTATCHWPLAIPIRIA